MSDAIFVRPRRHHGSCNDNPLCKIVAQFQKRTKLLFALRFVIQPQRRLNIILLSRTVCFYNKVNLIRHTGLFSQNPLLAINLFR